MRLITIVSCKCCHRKFATRAVEITKGRGKFCSLNCKNKFTERDKKSKEQLAKDKFFADVVE